MDYSEKIQQIISKSTGVLRTKIYPDVDLMIDLKLVEVDLNLLIYEIEREFNIHFPEDISNFKTPSKIINHVEVCLHQAPSDNSAC